MPTKVILDVDTGTDDAVALMVAALSPDLELVGVTTVNGNTTLDNTTDNTLRVFDWIGLPKTPVHRGMDRPLARTQMDQVNPARRIHGDHLDLPPASTARLQPGHAVDWLIQTYLDSAGDIVLCPVGPLTNIAMAILREPRIVERIPEIVIMGGAHDHGNVVGRKAVGEALDRGLVGLGLLDEPQNPPKGRLGPDSLSLDPKQPSFEDRRRKDVIAGVLLERHGFPGDRGLVDGPVAGRDPAVHRDALPGLDEDDLAPADRLGGDLDVAAVPLDARGPGGELQELLDRLAGALRGEPLQEVGEAHEEDDHGRRRVLTDRERAEDAQRHQRMRGDGPIPERSDHVAEDRDATHEDRRERQPR